MSPIHPLYLLQKEMKIKINTLTKLNQVTRAITSLDSQTTSTRRWREQEVHFPKNKVLVRPLRGVEVPQLLLARDVRKL